MALPRVQTYAASNVNDSSQPFRDVPIQPDERPSWARQRAETGSNRRIRLCRSQRKAMRAQRRNAPSSLCAATRSTIGYLVSNARITACRAVTASWTRPCRARTGASCVVARSSKSLACCRRAVAIAASNRGVAPVRSPLSAATWPRSRMQFCQVGRFIGINNERIDVRRPFNCG